MPDGAPLLVVVAQERVVEADVGALAAIGAGFVIAALARLLVPAVRTISWPTSAILAVVGASGAIAVATVTRRAPVLLFVALALGFTIVLLLVATVVERRLHPQVAVHATPTAELRRLGESDHVEFKSTARCNLHTGDKDAAMELVIAKTVCGFLNGSGGTLLIGVDDGGEVMGIAADLPFMLRPDVDAYELFLRDLLSRSLGVPAAAAVAVRFEGDIPEGAVCRVDVSPSPVPVYLTPTKGGGEPEMWVRSGNATRRLRIDEVLDYHRQRWGRLGGPGGRFRGS